MASLLSWAGNVAKGVERQLNPFDGGATYKNPTPASAPQRPVAPAPPLPTYPNFTRPNLPQLRSTPQTIPFSPHKVNGLDVAREAAGGIGRSLVNSVTGVPLHLFLEGQDMLTNTTPANRATFQASNPVTRAVFGNDPIKSYQGQAEDASASLKKMGVNPTLAGAASIPIAGLLAGMDLSQFSIAKGAKPAIESGAKAAVKTGNAAIDKAIQSYHESPLANQSGHIGLPGADQPRDVVGRYAADPKIEPAPQNAAEAYQRAIEAQHMHDLIAAQVKESNNTAARAGGGYAGKNAQLLDQQYGSTLKELQKDVAYYKKEAARLYTGDPNHTVVQGTTKPPVAPKPAAPREGIISRIKKIIDPVNNEKGSSDLFTPGKDSVPKGTKQRGFTTSVKNSPEVSPETQKLTEATYTPKKNAELIASSDKLIKGGLKKATDQVHSSLDGKGNLSDQAVADAIKVALVHDAKGNFREAADIFDKLSENQTELGRSVQAASILSRRSPQGLLYSAQRVLKKGGLSVTDPKIQPVLKGHIEAIKKTVAGSDERSLAVQRLVDFVNNKLPRSKFEAGAGLWRAGLLTGPETVFKIAMSHAFLLPELATRPLVAGVDRVVSHAPKQVLTFLNRHNPGYKAGTRTATVGTVEDTKAFLGGMGGGAKAAWSHLTTGEDAPHTGGFEKTLGKGTHQTPYERGIYRIHGSVYKPFYSGAYKLEMANQRRIAMSMFKGDTAKVDAFLKSPEAMQKATTEAEKFAMQNLTEGGKLAQQLQHIKLGPIPIGMWLAPFTRIPAALGTKGIVDYTPLGTMRAAKALYSGIVKGTFDQRKFVTGLGKSGIGGTAVVATGAFMMGAGRMTLQEPADPKEKALWDAQGKARNSVYIGGQVTNDANGTPSYHGGQWVTLNTMGPLGIALGIGGAFHQALEGKADISTSVATAVGSGIKLLADQPYMKGITGPANALTKPAQFASGYIQSSVTSFVPALLNQAARGFDQTQRAAPDNLGQAIAQTIPGLRGTTTPKTDLYGADLPGSNPSGSVLGGVLGTINPFYPSSERNQNVATQELQRLYNLQGNQGPNVSNPKTIAGTPTSQLSSQQIHDFVASSGPTIKTAIGNLIANPRYQGLNDSQKTGAINSAISAIRDSTVLSPKTGYLPSGPVSGSSGDIIKTIGTYAKAFMTDPGTALTYLLNGQTIVRTQGGGLVVQRAGVKDTQALVNSRGGSTQNGVPMQLDHVIPIELGGSNAVANLKLITQAQDNANNAAENFLGKQLNSGAINMKTAQQLITDYKNGQLSGPDLFTKAGGSGTGMIPSSGPQIGVDTGSVASKKLSHLATSAALNPDSIGTGAINVSSKTGKASLSVTGAGADPKTAYQTKLAAYQAAKAAGTLTPTQDFKTQASLAREAVTSNYSAEAQSFYSMSKAQQAAMLQTQPDIAKPLYAEARQLDAALLSSGQISSSKYKSGLASTKKGGSTAKATAAKSRVKAQLASFNKINNLPKRLGVTYKAPKVPKVPKVTLASAKAPKGIKVSKPKALPKLQVAKVPKTANVA